MVDSYGLDIDKGFMVILDKPCMDSYEFEQKNQGFVVAAIGSNLVEIA